MSAHKYRLLYPQNRFHMGFTAAAMQVFGFFSVLLLVGWLIKGELQLEECFGTPGGFAINGREEHRILHTEGRNNSFSFPHFNGTLVSEGAHGLCTFFTFYEGRTVFAHVVVAPRRCRILSFSFLPFFFIFCFSLLELLN